MPQARSLFALAMVCSIGLVVACGSPPRVVSAPPTMQGAPPVPSVQSHPPAAPDTTAAVRDRMAKEVLASIAGHETEPAGQVFKNIKSLNAVPASRLVAIMNNGYGRSLGVTCAHCHVVGQWASDAKPEKQIARDMIAMAATINTQLLANIKNLKGPQPIVNCTTCHRGSVKPALNMQ
jgi:hypothetical protein